MDYKLLPVGYENFSQIINEGYYYVDKTMFIRELMDKKAKVNLYTRPRRFGKTLTLSMLKYFFEEAYDRRGGKVDNSRLFEGLQITNAGERYTSLMGKYPVIALTLKSGKQDSFELSCSQICEVIVDEFERHQYILDGSILTEREKTQFDLYLNKRRDAVDFISSIKFLCHCLHVWHGTAPIVLIDEYDVPLEGAYRYGFYDKMVVFIRGLFENTLKTNDDLSFAVVTGCLRIARESIFTGLNNLRINSIMTKSFGEYFGFTCDEVQAMCAYYDMPEKYEQLRDWYNGYVFGDVNVYNPWSTVQYLYDRMIDREGYPAAYWADTSSNTIVRKLIERADRAVKDEIENLIAGGSIEKAIHEDITYDEVEKSMDNLWNFMFFTGYFKKTDSRFENRICYVTMVIPNQEVLYIFENKIKGWFEDTLKATSRQRLYDAIVKRDADTLRNEIRGILYSTISFHDYYENFYHGFMAGILYGMDRYVVKSNRESGNGRTDIFLKPAFYDMPAYIFEFKVAGTIDQLESEAAEAIRQIYDNRYDEELRADGYRDIVCFGVAFYKKDCFVGTE